MLVSNGGRDVPPWDLGFVKRSVPILSAAYDRFAATNMKIGARAWLVASEISVFNLMLEIRCSQVMIASPIAHRKRANWMSKILAHSDGKW
jgi:hypothetical protein